MRTQAAMRAALSRIRTPTLPNTHARARMQSLPLSLSSAWFVQRSPFTSSTPQPVREGGRRKWGRGGGKGGAGYGSFEHTSSNIDLITSLILSVTYHNTVL